MARDVEHEIQQLHVIDPHPRARRDARGRARWAWSSRASRRSPRCGSATRSPTPRARRRAAAGLPRREADGVRAGSTRSSPTHYENLKAALEKLQLQRRLARLRARDERGARLRLPLRLPRLPALGDRAGAARARVQPQPDLDRADRALPRGEALGARRRRSRARRRCPSPPRSSEIEEPMIARHDPRAARVRRARSSRSARSAAACSATWTHHGSRVQVRYELPLAEVVLDFHDRIKSATRGYGSFDYELIGYQPARSREARRAGERRSRSTRSR